MTLWRERLDFWGVQVVVVVVIVMILYVADFGRWTHVVVVVVVRNWRKRLVAVPFFSVFFVFYFCSNDDIVPITR